MKVTISKNGDYKNIAEFMEVLPELCGNIEVMLPDDLYFLRETMAFTYENMANKTIKFFGGKKTVISGGVPIKNWKKEANTPLWYANSPIKDYRRLYVNNVTAERGRSESEYLSYDAIPGDFSWRDGFVMGEQAIDKYKNESDIELVWNTARWRHFRHGVEKIEYAKTPSNRDGIMSVNRLIYMKQPYYSYGAESSPDDSCIYKPVHGNKFWVENAKELLTKPGQWYLDKSEQIVYYYPKNDENMDTSVVIAPMVEKLVSICGKNLQHKVENVEFHNISFRFAAWNKPTNEGFACIQAQMLNCSSNRQGTPKREYVDGNIEVDFACNILFSGCGFRFLGGDAIRLINAVTNFKVENSDFRNISDGAIQVGLPEHQLDASKNENCCENIKIIGNKIQYIGEEFPSAPALTLYYPVQCKIAHNEIGFVPYSGISLGWGWSTAVENVIMRDNLIENNIIHDFMMVTVDGAGIYTLGFQENTVIRNNYIYNEHNDFGGVYTDNGSTNISVYGNVFENVKRFIFVWEPTITNIKAYDNYTDSLCSLMDGTECATYNNHYFEKGMMSAEAQKIVSNAGVTPISKIDGGRDRIFNTYYRINKNAVFSWYNQGIYEANGLVLDLGGPMIVDKIFYELLHNGDQNYIKFFGSGDNVDFVEIGYEKVCGDCGCVKLENEVEIRYLCGIVEIHQALNYGLMPIKFLSVR